SKNSDVKFDVEGSLIFINDDFRLTAEDQTVFEKTVTRSYVRNYMKKLNSRNRGNRAKKIANIINKHKVSNEFFDKNTDISMLKLGLYCGECKSYDLEKNKFHFTCNRSEERRVGKECTEGSWMEYDREKEKVDKTKRAQ